MTEAAPPVYGVLPEKLQDGRYTLHDVLGHGGMAVVFRAHDRRLNVDRAVKIITHTGQARASLRRRLVAEARAMARLQHPNILSIHDIGREAGFDYVVMDLAESGSLQDLLEKGAVEPVLAVQYMLQVLSALTVAHAAGIVHRDVKPHNVLLDSTGRGLLADFGIALLSTEDRRTRTGVAMGSMAYMPPEQRLDAARVGPTADIYAVGTTLYNLITGLTPMDLFLASPESPRWAAVPQTLLPILRKAVMADPNERYENAQVMSAALLDAYGHALSAQTTFAPTTGQGLTPPGVPEATRAAMTFLEEHVTVFPGGLLLDEDLAREVREELGDDAPALGPPALATRARLRWLVPLGAIVLLIGVVLGVVWAIDRQPTQVAASWAPEIPAIGQGSEVSPSRVEANAPLPVASKPRPVARSVVAGRWSGTLNGIVVDLELSDVGSGVTGTLTSRFASRVIAVPVRGTFDAGNRELTLSDDEGIVYALQMAAGALRGQVIHPGGTRPLVLKRSK